MVAALAVPMIVQNTLTNVVSLLDNLMIGAVGTEAMAAVAIVNQLLFVFSLCVFGILSGVGIFSTQFAGARDDEGVRHCFRLKLLTILVTTALFIVAFLLFPEPLISCFLKGEATPAELEATVEAARHYLAIMLFNIPPFAFAMTYASSLREVGETRMPMVASIAAILINLLFNYLLIFGHWGFPQMGVKGAAWATVISRVAELIIIVGYAHLRHGRFRFLEKAYCSMHVPKTLLLGGLKQGTPLLVNEVCWAVGMAMLMQSFSLRGLHVIAACNIAMTVSNIFNSAFYSMGGAVAVIIGQELGANRMQRARGYAWKLMLLTVLVASVMSLILSLFAPFIPKWYNTTQDVQRLATIMMWIGAAGSPFYAISHVGYFTIRSGGRSYHTFLLDSGFTWLVLWPVTWSLAYFTTLPILPLFFISRLTETTKCIAALILVKSNIWMQNIIGKG